ncbi:MAG: hypothetical protein SGI77_05460 [Pirellulaceae bacterium]|nr:hypothetical protein [Pirellulaceae bacterium]
MSTRLNRVQFNGKHGGAPWTAGTSAPSDAPAKADLVGQLEQAVQTRPGTVLVVGLVVGGIFGWLVSKIAR